MTDPDPRLPGPVRPIHYALAIHTDLVASHFTGEAIIDLDVGDRTDSIVFNLHPSLSVSRLVLSADGKRTELALESLTVDGETERATILLREALGSGRARLFVRWEAPLGENMMGYYRSSGDADASGNRPSYALTMFAPVAARSAFPCWDEPEHKATYDMVMVAREGETVLSNMPVASSEAWVPGKVDPLVEGYRLGSTFAPASGKWVATTFKKTPPMSTYLLCFACGDFAHLESEYTSRLTGKSVPLRIYATPNQVSKAEFALDVKRACVPVYEELFGIPYPLPKLDTLVAHDFDMGAMENWGLITGRTTAFLVDERSSLAAKKRVGTLQMHEVAHMWFGDIVTMKWWDNLWLNEAFATLMGSLVMPERLYPEWEQGSEFLVGQWVRAMGLDCRRTSHPIEAECPDTNYINSIFDAISYSKGASVLRMLMGVVGEAKFFEGVSLYLKKHLYGNAQSSDLWAGVSQAVGRDMGAIMADWTLKHRFLSSGDVRPDEDETLWWVPLEIKTLGPDGVHVDHESVLDSRSTTVKVASDSFKLNTETIGFYRVKYSSERLAKIATQAQSFTINDRIGLLSDVSALASAGYSKASEALTFATAVAENETQYLALDMIATLLGKIAQVWWEDDSVREAIDAVSNHIFGPVVGRMGYEHAESDSPDTKELRALAVTTCAAARNPSVLAELIDRFRSLLTSGDDSRIPPDLQRAIFTAAVREGGEEEYTKVLEVYNSPLSNPSTKVDAMMALCASTSPALLDRTFDMLGDSKAIKDQDLSTFFVGLGVNRFARRRIAHYLMDNWASLNDRFNASFGLRNTIGGALGSLSSQSDLDHINKFIVSNDIRKYKQVVDQTVEGIEASVAWLARDDDDVRLWLKENKFL